MRTGRSVITVAAAGILAVAPAASASAAPDTGGGCRDFGLNVVSLATDPDTDFGGNASFAATQFPGSFPALVVMPEQDELCAETGS